MIILHMWDSFANTNIHNNPVVLRNCEIFRNIYALCVNLYMGYEVVRYYYFDVPIDVLYIADMLQTHLYIDMFFIQNDFIYVHHFVGLAGIYTYKNFMWRPIEDYQECSAILYATEVSSIFLCVREIIRHMNWKKKYRTLYVWNNRIFGIVFYWTRIIMFLSYFFFSDDFPIRLRRMQVNEYAIQYSYTLLYGLFAMNLYWGWKIVENLTL